MAVRRVSGPGLDRLKIAMRDLKGVRGKVGFFETAKYPDGTPVALVAAVHEGGAPNAGIPPRPFFRPAIAEHGDEWGRLMEQGAKSVLKGNTSARAVLEAVTLKAAGDVGKAIVAVTSPPLKDATIAAKVRKRKSKEVGSLSKPLVDTGLMVQSVTGVVEDKR